MHQSRMIARMAALDASRQGMQADVDSRRPAFAQSSVVHRDGKLADGDTGLTLFGIPRIIPQPTDADAALDDGEFRLVREPSILPMRNRAGIDCS